MPRDMHSSRSAKAAEPDDASDGDGIDRCLVKLDKYRETVKKSQLLQESIEALDAVRKNVTMIRALALGSPTDSNIALYQLAYMIELSDSLEVELISLFDPIFSDADKRLFDVLKMLITGCNNFESKSTLWFLPHALLDVTNALLLQAKPMYLLANNVITHTDRLTKLKLHDSYDHLSLLVNLIEPPPVVKEEHFTVVERKSKRKNKLKFEPPKIVYDYSQTYFSKVNQHVLEHTKGKWGNAFTDLAFHEIS